MVCCFASQRLSGGHTQSLGELIMTRTLKGSLLIASMMVVLSTTSSQACHRRRACQPAPCGQATYGYASPVAYHDAGGGYGMGGGGYYNGGYGGGMGGGGYYNGG